ncbi:molybdenum cofactor sulfurase [Naviculisporaceae sp. PSN 640]
MKISSLYVYPIKSLRGIPLRHAELTPQGIKHDRIFMLYAVKPNGEWDKMQLSHFPQCALFDQQIVTFTSPEGGSKSIIAVEYNQPKDGGGNDGSPLSAVSSRIEVPLEPDISHLERVDVDLHASPTSAYRMGDVYDQWFTSCLGIPVVLVYIGDGRRAVLGETLLPEKHKPKKPTTSTTTTTSGGWMSSLTSYIPSSLLPITKTENDDKNESQPWLTFTDVAPLLIASESSLNDVTSRLAQPSPPVDMYKFRPNVVVDGAGYSAWDEDFWGELTVTSSADERGGASKKTAKLLLTGNCVRCTSLNVDYETGRPAEGELGTVLKKLMKDRRVDRGSKWSPVFGRYASVDFDQRDGNDDGEVSVKTISVGDEVEVTGRIEERSVWDWPGL